MKSLEQREQREYERRNIVNRAVGEADRIILDGSDGSVEETDWLTSEVAKRFVEKVNIALSSKLLSRDLSDQKPEYFAIFSPKIDEVIGICTGDGKSYVETANPHCKFISITKQQFDTFGDDPGQWKQLDEIGIEKPK